MGHRSDVADTDSPHHNSPDIDTDTYLSSVGYACFEGLPEMIMNNPIRMGHGAIINGHGGPG